MADISPLPLSRPTPPASGEQTCFVRVTDADHHGYVAFQFAIGEPTLFLDMLLPPPAFAEFCARHRARHMTAAEAAAVDASAACWRDGDTCAEQAP